jgi:glyoxylase-like metal-dependent hydrolase (beta-lactamase superfamily II)
MTKSKDGDPERRSTRARSLWLLAAPLLLWLGATACSGRPSAQAPLTQRRELETLMQLAAYPNSETTTVLIAMQQFLSTHSEWEGFDFFGRLAAEQPARRTLFRSLQGVMQARVAGDVFLLRRVAWVEDAIAKLDEGAAADPLLGRFARGLVFADLPDRFGKARQAVDDLEACRARSAEFPFPLERGMLVGLAAAYHTLGDDDRSRAMIARAGLAAEGLGGPRILGDMSVDAATGFRFSGKRFVNEGDGVFVAEGYDFANLSFIVTSTFVVAIDAGTTEPTARDAVNELRKVTKAPIKYVILTHGHWDHAGGLAAVREPGSTVIAQSGFPAELARSRAYAPPFRYFFGGEPLALDVHPDRLVASRETLVDGDLDLELIPVRGGETDDALFIHDRKHDLLFVGDAFMPYLGAPFVAEGSAEGYLDAIATVLQIRPRRLLHGHPPLTAFFTMGAMPGLLDALTALHDRTVSAAHLARPLADVLHDDFVPPGLRSAPLAALPYVIARDTFVQRTYASEAGYWQSNGEGVDQFTRGEWAAALDLLGGKSEASFVRVVDDLALRGDALLALRIADIALVAYPQSAPLDARRARVLHDLRERYAQTNPFRFILYSEWSGRGMSPVQYDPPAPAAAKSSISSQVQTRQ